MSDKARLCVTDATVEMGLSKVGKTLKKRCIAVQYNIPLESCSNITLWCNNYL